jgi:hypothetical protein
MVAELGEARVGERAWRGSVSPRDLAYCRYSRQYCHRLAL